MPFPAGPWQIAVLLGMLALSPCEARAGMTPEEVIQFKIEKARAEHGDAVSQDNLGIFYSDGLGVQKDQVVAFSWFMKSAEQGDAGGQHNLGNCYLS